MTVHRRPGGGGRGGASVRRTRISLSALVAITAGLGVAAPAPGSADPEPMSTNPSGASRPVSPDASVPNDESELLAGPRLRLSDARTLIERNAKGEFRRLTNRPEEEAVKRLDLDPSVRAQVDDVVAQRRTELRLFVIDHMDEALEIVTATESKDRDKAEELSRRLYRAFSPDQPRDPLMPALARVLSLDDIAEVHRLVNEYWEGLVAWELRNRKPKDRTPEKCRETEERLAYQVFKDELRSAYETSLQPYREKFERLEKAVRPTPGQRQEIVDIVKEYVRRTRTRPSEAERKEVMGRIYRVLDDDRRAKFFDLVVGDVAAGMW